MISGRIFYEKYPSFLFIYRKPAFSFFTPFAGTWGNNAMKTPENRFIPYFLLSLHHFVG